MPEDSAGEDMLVFGGVVVVGASVVLCEEYEGAWQFLGACD